jgi:hypothetical protein
MYFPKNEKVQPLPQWYGWRQDVIVCDEARAFLEKHRLQWQAMFVESHVNKNGVFTGRDLSVGWKTALAEEVSRIMPNSHDAVIRRIHAICSKESGIIFAEYLDAACISLGLHIDYDTQMTILPGNRSLAHEMIESRAFHLGLDLTHSETNEYREQLLNVTLRYLKYPHERESLKDLAPLDALRPYQ